MSFSFILCCELSECFIYWLFLCYSFFSGDLWDEMHYSSCTFVVYNNNNNNLKPLSSYFIFGLIFLNRTESIVWSVSSPTKLNFSSVFCLFDYFMHQKKNTFWQARVVGGGCFLGLVASKILSTPKNFLSLKVFEFFVFSNI